VNENGSLAHSVSGGANFNEGLRTWTNEMRQLTEDLAEEVARDEEPRFPLEDPGNRRISIAPRRVPDEIETPRSARDSRPSGGCIGLAVGGALAGFALPDRIFGLGGPDERLSGSGRDL
jgi:hypothetical protein